MRRLKLKASHAEWISLVLCLAVSFLVLVADSATRVATAQKISAVSFNEVRPGTVPLPPGASEEMLVLPYHSIDARWWVMHTKQMIREGAWRVRYTNLDNAPEGREVHWSSLLMWILAGLAWLHSLGSGQSAELFVPPAALVVGPLMFVFMLIGLIWLASRVFGCFVALFYGTALVTSFAVLRTFQAGEADHHGIVLVFLSASLLSLFGGSGDLPSHKNNRVRNDMPPSSQSASRWFIASGLFGAMALWVSAATALPILVATGLGAVLSGFVALWTGKRKNLQPRLWLAWGIAGCSGSLFFYALEYFPSHMSWRLEVNHPLYAFAWLAGGFLLASLLSSIKEQRLPALTSAFLGKTALALAVTALPLLAVIFFPKEVFWVSDEFLLSLHKEYIVEFQSFFTLVQLRDRNPLVWLVNYPWVFATVAGIALLWSRRDSLEFLPVLLPLVLPPVLLMQSLALWQVRWGSAAFALWALVAVLVLADALALPSGTRLRRLLPLGLIATAWLALLLGILPQVLQAAREEATCLQAPLSENVGGNLLVRDIAHRLVHSSPDRMPVVLTGPNTATEMSYHAGIRTLGTLYWENMPGLKKAAEIFSALNEDEALRLLTEAGVTHIVVPSWGNFATAYANLLAKAHGLENVDTPFFNSILEQDNFPDWLRPFAYPIPSGAGIDARSVKIFAVLPEQNKFESLFFKGIYYAEIGQADKALAFYRQASRLRPGDMRIKEAIDQLRLFSP